MLQKQNQILNKPIPMPIPNINTEQIIQVPNGLRYEKGGWIYVSLSGEARERGKAYGELLKEDMKNVRRILDFVIYNDYGVKWEFFIEAGRKYFLEKLKRDFPEFYEEMEGFSSGSGWSIDEVVAWNNYMTLTESWWANMPEEDRLIVYGTSGKKDVSSKEGGSGQVERCSGFIAVGDWTTDGKIVCAHNNFSNFIDGQLAKYVIDMKPPPGKGSRMLWQGFPGFIWSGTDFFVNGAGILGTETTIGGFNQYENNTPICCRIRNVMQYAVSLDDCERMLLQDNSGDYANSWLFGDVNINEIMRIELGLRFHLTERTTNGFFIGFNAPYDPRIRNLECANTGFNDVRRHQGARKVRLSELLDKWKGKLDVETAKAILADHYDVYLKKENNPCSRTCCSHYDLDGREYMSDPSRPLPFQPRGAVDGNVIDTALAKNMSFVLRWGNSCGTPFIKDEFIRKNRVWEHLAPYLEDRPRQEWTTFRINGNDDKKQEITEMKHHNHHPKHTHTHKNMQHRDRDRELARASRAERASMIKSRRFTRRILPS